MDMSYLYPSRVSAPCKGCKNRRGGATDCHSDCEKYQEYKRKKAEETAMLRKEKSREGFLQGRETFHHYWA